MTKAATAAESRRQFLKFLAASPLVGSAALLWPEELGGRGDHGTWLERLQSSADGAQGPQGDYLISSPDQAINVFDFETKARDVMPPAHWSYMATGTDDDATLRANREGFSTFVWHPRRLVDVSEVDVSVEVFGQKLGSPVFTCPTSFNRRFHPDGELAVARACKVHNNAQMIATPTSYSMKDV